MISGPASSSRTRNWTSIYRGLIISLLWPRGPRLNRRSQHRPSAHAPAPSKETGWAQPGQQLRRQSFQALGTSDSLNIQQVSCYVSPLASCLKSGGGKEEGHAILVLVTMAVPTVTEPGDQGAERTQIEDARGQAR